jgi:hypothetical protein
MNLLNVAVGAAQGFVASGGNPIGAGIGALGAATTGNAGATATGSPGDPSNAALATAQNAYLAATAAQQIGQMNFQLQQQQQANAFDDMTAEKSEMLRESNELRNVSMEQRKADTEITKEFIKSIA